MFDITLKDRRSLKYLEFLSVLVLISVKSFQIYAMSCKLQS